MKNTRLKTAIALGLIVGILLPTVIAGWYTLQNQRKVLVAKMEEEHLRITKVLALEMEKPIWTMVKEEGNSLIDAMMTSKDIVRILVHSEDGPFIERNREGAMPECTSTKTLPVIFHDHILGDVRVTFDTGQTLSALVRQTTLFMFTTAAQLLVSLALIIFLLNIKVLKPVKRLLIQSRHLADNTLQKEFTWEQTDELGMLGQSFELSRQSLLKLFEDLRKKNIQLAHRAGELAIAKRTADAANQAKSDFLANMSHELRTPLHHITGFTELILRRRYGELTAAQDKHLGNVLKSSQHLLALINDILDLSKIEAGKQELERSEVNVRDLIAQSLVIIQEKSMQQNINVVLDIQNIPEHIMADERKLTQILYNLLANAIKFTESGGEIRLTATTRTARDMEKIYNLSLLATARGGDESLQESAPEESHLLDTEDFLEIVVSDTGIGIDFGDQDRIFTAFEQVAGPSDHLVQGTGLGLSLTRKLVELHGGIIWVESKGKNKGTLFRFVIPVYTAAGTPPDHSLVA